MNHKEYLEGLADDLDRIYSRVDNCRGLTPIRESAEALRVMVKLIDAVKFTQQHTTAWEIRDAVDTALFALDEWKKER